MKTTIEIDRDLLEEAQKALGAETIRETVETSLKETVRRQRLRGLADALGTIELDLTPAALRRRRWKRTRRVSN